MSAVLTPVTALTTWQFVPLVSVPLALCAALYLAGTRAVARRHLLLIMVAPPLLVYGRPVTLLLHAARNPWHARVIGVVRSKAVTTLTWPPFCVLLYSAVVLATHLTPLILARGWLPDGEHLAYLVAGYLFFLPVVGSQPARSAATAPPTCTTPASSCWAAAS